MLEAATDDVLTDPELNEDEPQGADDQTETEGAASAEGADEGVATEEVVITIGDEAPPEEDPEPATPAIRQLREAHRQQARDLRALRQENERLKQEKAAPFETEQALGERPKLADFDYDEDKHAEAVETWTARKVQADAEKRKRQEQAEAAAAEWNNKLAAHAKAAQSLKVRDYEGAQEAVKEAFSVVQQSLVIQAADSPESSARIVAALGTNPAKLKELAAIADPVKFTKALTRLEDQLKTVVRKMPPPPDSPVRGVAPGAAVNNAHLDKLRAKAQETGDYAAYYAAKRAREQKRA